MKLTFAKSVRIVKKSHRSTNDALFTTTVYYETEQHELFWSLKTEVTKWIVCSFLLSPFGGLFDVAHIKLFEIEFLFLCFKCFYFFNVNSDHSTKTFLKLIS